MGERKTIGFKLKQLRENSGLRQGQIAEFLGVDQSYVSKIEADERALPIEQLEKLWATLLKCALRRSMCLWVWCYGMSCSTRASMPRLQVLS